ncbi:hypothetical protein PILCRDRAFT_824482 [Piloderma croceum F 1598]|uniref:Uncharacterized protein n=1 Tax=Piloderma croceum (strain F 1598) TaxID=765440 RepID=A0A0C3F0F2_PILCF|nr:hypothetical protein PILCRDRAFT_824482 [Piloderma croceum F 1598]
MGVPLLPAPSPTLTYLLALFFQAPLPLPGPSHPPALACSPYPPFRFFDTLYGCSPATSTIPHHNTSIDIVFHRFLSPA